MSGRNVNETRSGNIKRKKLIILDSKIIRLWSSNRQSTNCNAFLLPPVQEAMFLTLAPYL
jgi:hypothetical protein